MKIGPYTLGYIAFFLLVGFIIYTSHFESESIIPKKRPAIDYSKTKTTDELLSEQNILLQEQNILLQEQNMLLRKLLKMEDVKNTSWICG